MREHDFLARLRSDENEEMIVKIIQIVVLYEPFNSNTIPSNSYQYPLEVFVVIVIVFYFILHVDKPTPIGN